MILYTDIQINGAEESPELDSVGHIGWLIDYRIILSQQMMLEQLDSHR